MDFLISLALLLWYTIGSAVTAWLILYYSELKRRRLRLAMVACVVVFWFMLEISDITDLDEFNIWE